MPAMDTEPRKLDPVEMALLELDGAERARMFERTRVDVDGLLAERMPVSSLKLSRTALRLLPVAAAVALAVGVGSWMFSVKLAELREGRVVLSGFVADAAAPSLGRFHECFKGPTDVLPAACREQDFDADGDVDLADFGAFQLAYAQVTR
jgi:hypothetical protein